MGYNLRYAACDGEPKYAYGDEGFLGSYLQALHGDAEAREYSLAAGGPLCMPSTLNNW